MVTNWPETALESVSACPYCSSSRRCLAHSHVEDWSFNVASGKWSYYQCSDCASLYLDPRPDRDSIGEAYNKYYTHDTSENRSFVAHVRTLIKNDWLSYLLKTPVLPRLKIPLLILKFSIKISGKTDLPFWIDELKVENPGKFLDMGSGSGHAVKLAMQLGWDSMGIDFDPAAVDASNKKGLKILLGDELVLSKYQHYFDYVLCSHVLEHVHDPRGFIQALGAAVKPEGALVLSLPNATSKVRAYFGDYWRGLEAPRHLSIPSQLSLIRILKSHDFEVTIKSDDSAETLLESLRLKRKGERPAFIDRLRAIFIKIRPDANRNTNDFIKLVCIKKSR